MNLIDRAKNMIVSPAKEWDVINGEQPDIAKIITGYVLPLAGAAAVAAFIGYGLIGVGGWGIKIKGISWGLYYALTMLLLSIALVFICAFVIDALAPSFGSEKNLGRSVQLVAYGLTPYWLGSLFAILPAIAIIGLLAGLYAFYLFYIGMPKLKKTPADKLIGYYVVSLITVIVVYFVVGLILNKILFSVLGLSYGFGNIKIDF